MREIHKTCAYCGAWIYEDDEQIYDEAGNKICSECRDEYKDEIEERSRGYNYG